MNQKQSNKRGVRVPYDQLSPETLDAVMEEFITREGTDYGKAEVPLGQKIERVKKQLETGRVLIVFDESTGSCNIISKDDPRLRGPEGEG